MPTFFYTVKGFATSTKIFNYADEYTVQASAGHKFATNYQAPLMLHGTKVSTARLTYC